MRLFSEVGFFEALSWKGSKPEHLNLYELCDGYIFTNLLQLIKEPIEYMFKLVNMIIVSCVRIAICKYS